ncbi:MAG: putative RNase H-like HicB family nuclease [Candidatus Omnitrophota bacterium]|jgi:predicted RNase H-like HicB family nuclease
MSKASYSTNLPLEILKEGKWFIVHCPILDVTAQGESPEDAKDSFKETLELVMSDLIKRGNLDAYLTKLGWRKSSKPKKHWIPPTFIKMMDTHVTIPV